MKIRKLAAEPDQPGHGAIQARGIGRLNGSELKAVTIDAGGSVDPHRHAHAHLVLVLSGAGFVDQGGSPRHIGPDAVVMVAPEEEHAFGAAPAEPLQFVCLDGAGE